MALSNDNNRTNDTYRTEKSDRNRQNDEQEGPKAAHRTPTKDLSDEDFDDEFNFDIEER